MSATSACPGNLYTHTHVSIPFLDLCCSKFFNFVFMNEESSRWLPEQELLDSEPQKSSQSVPTKEQVKISTLTSLHVIYNLTLKVFFYLSLITDLPVLQPLTFGPLV